ncbi:MAG TPA: hypothetical protein VMM36_06425 [Opitutaceae bacterium]|nr:hypothetical protein [Opitutaceae bacterium]
MHSSRLTAVVTLFAGFAMAGLSSLSAQPSSPPTHEIGSIPPLRVWYSAQAQAEFFVEATALGTGATLSATFDSGDGIAGSRTFDAATGRFRYVPAPTDAQPFSVTFEGVNGSASAAQTVVITPLRPLPAESVVFGLQPKGALPDGASTDFLDVATKVIKGTLSAQTVWFNTLNRPSVRSVTIVGKTVVLEPDHPNGLWGFNNAADIRDLTIHAEILVIRGALELPQTNIEIRATEVRFEDQEGKPAASISTKPLSIGTQPAQFFDGRAGHNGGGLVLFADAVTGAGSAKRFILSGGNGERAGQGKKGDNGANRPVVHEIKNGIYGFKWTDNNTIYAHFDGLFDTSAGSTTWPGDGKPATAGGKPGIAGDGGSVLSNLDLSAWIVNAGGVQGTVATYQSGGTGGTPRQAWRRYYTSSGLKSYDERFSTNGSGASGPNSAKISGAVGAITASPGDLRWLSPLALEKVLMHVRQAYLAQHFDFVRETLADYVELLELANSLPEWAALDAAEHRKLLQILDEMRMLRHRVDSNLDYFGNPAGWVPMLSFEVTKLAFENEIPRALRVMYLDYWLRNRANAQQRKVDTMTQLRTQLREQILADRAAYDTAVAAVPELQYQARQVQDEINQVKTDIETIKNDLLPKAKNIALLKKTARALGAIAEVIPVGQPFVGVAGNVLGRLPDVDPDKPFEQNALIIGTAVAGDVADSEMESATLALKARLGALDSDDIDNAVASRTDEIRAMQKPVMDLLGESLNQMRTTQNPSPEVEAELQRLLADEPGFKVLSKRLKKLDGQKLEFATKLAQTFQEVSRLSLAITRDLLTIDILNRNIADVTIELDAETLGALDEMTQRARDRLLRYHYFMARAYEYRMLDAYDGDLDLTKITDRFTTLGTATGPNLTADEFDSLRAVYEDQISSVVFTILNTYNSNRPTLSAPVRLTLPAAILDELNAGNPAALNLNSLGIFLPDQENVRIVNLKVLEMDVTYTGSKDDIFYADVIFQHSGVSRLQKEGETHLFRHYNEETRSKIEWASRFDPFDSSIDPVQPAAADQSLLKAMLSTGSSSPSTDDLLLYSRPAADAELILSRQINSRNGAALTITRVRIELQYDFSRMSDQIRTLNVAPAADGPQSRVTVVQTDRNGRTDGEGEFERAYNVGATVTLAAAERIGQYQFDRWEGAGVASPNAATTSVSMSASRSVTPVYRLLTPRTLSVTGGTGSGTYVNGDVVPIAAVVPQGYRFVRWNGPGVATPTAAQTTVTLTADQSVSASFEPIVAANPSAIINVSCRAFAGAGDSTLVVGFYISGTGSKTVLIRGIGPRLLDYIPGPVVADPAITLYSGDTPIEFNEDWDSALAADFAQVGAFSLVPGSKDAAMKVTLQPGLYTVHLVNDGPVAEGLIEVYDLSRDPGSRLTNVSCRLDMQPGQTVILGTSLIGDALPVLARNVGPGIAPYIQNPADALVDPHLRVYSGQTEIAVNDNWDPATGAYFGPVGAFGLPNGSKDAAIRLEFQPGGYTVHATGNGGGGIAIIELYESQ